MDKNNIDRYRNTLEQSVGMPFSDGNKISILTNGEEIFPAMLAAINAAKHRINFVTFVYWQGEIAEEFAATLANQAKAGVLVRVLLDAFGANSMPDKLVSLMEDAGVELRWFRPVSTWRLWRSDKRTHRKILTCDDKIAFTGGVGIAEEWTGDARNSEEWRETHLQISGPAVGGLRAAFLDNWNEAGEWLFETPSNRNTEYSNGVAIQVVRSSTTIRWTNISTLMRTLIEVSHQQIFITTAYFAPEPVIVQLLCAAAKRGVDVRVLMPGEQTDSRLSQLAGQRDYQDLLDAGVKLIRYQKTMLHAKLLTVDGLLCCVGSANLNRRSLGKDEECSIVAISQEVTEKIDQQFLADCEYGDNLNSQDWQSRALSEKIKERLAGLLEEQL